MATDLDDIDTLMPDIAIPPGELLQEEIGCRGIAEEEFARRIGITLQDMDRLFVGEKAITQDIADAIERELGISAYIWVRMEASYQRVLAHLKERESTSQSVEMTEFTHDSDGQTPG